ncbi:MAG TPA: hypothetical protein VL401_03615 [Alphaproteobacteria bacterium]|jgi:hypothetical protein|nr:hypothetical protein [Alphaproteobacteria bacterium]
METNTQLSPERKDLYDKFWGGFCERRGINLQDSYPIKRMYYFLSTITAGGFTKFGKDLTGDPRPENEKLVITFSQDGQLSHEQSEALELLKVLDFDTTVVSTVSTRDGNIQTHHQILAVEKTLQKNNY